MKVGSASPRTSPVFPPPFTPNIANNITHRFARETPTTENTMAEQNTAPPAVDEPKVDESSINPPSAVARRNSLEKLLAHRPDRTELVESKGNLTK